MTPLPPAARLIAAALATTLATSAGCRRTTPPPSAVARPAPAPSPAFTHPLLAGASTEAVREDCSKRALATVAERLRTMEHDAPPARERSPHARRAKPACVPAQAEAAAANFHEELLPRIGACVGRDGANDVEWAMANSAALSLGLCLDCRQAPPERTARCGRANDILARVERAVRDRAP